MISFYPPLSENRAAEATSNAKLRPLLLGLIGLLVATSAGAQTAASLNLAWDPSSGSGIAGYRLYQGGASHVYTNSVRLGNVTSATVSGLAVGGVYYFAVTAYTANGVESAYSSEITYTAVSAPTSPVPPVTAAATLVAAYGFDEGSGTTVQDLSGKNNTGSLAGATWTSAGRFGNALAFNGTNQTAVTVNDAPSLDLTSAFTLEAWVYPTVAGTGWEEIIYKGDAGNDCYYLEGSTPTGAAPAVGVGSLTPPGTTLNGASSLPVNVWTHVAGTYDGATLCLYVNGALVVKQAQTGLVPTSTQVLSIGGDTLHATYFTGLIDEVRVYNGALSASQIQTDMNTPVTPPVIATAPTIALSAPANGAVYTSPASINLAVDVTANGHAITKVQFYNGATLLAEGTGAPYTFMWNNVSAGNYQLTVQAVYDSGSIVGSSAVNVTVAPGGLVAAYGFEEGSGTAVSDASGTGNTGTINGASWTASGRYGSALVFDGSSAVVTINNSASLQLTAGMTLEAWVNPSSASSLWRDVVYKGDDNYYLEGTSVNSGYIGAGGTFSSDPLYAASGLTVNTWTHLAATYDGATLSLYVNGVQVASQAQPGTIATSENPLQVGGDGFYGQYFEGTIDEVRVYNRALSAGEIAMDMNTPVVPGTASSVIAAALTSAPASVLPAPWEGIDVGDGSLPGSETITGDLYSVTGAGTLSDLTDTFRFLYQPMSGDGEISAQIGSLDSTNADGRAGVMVRETLTSGSRYAFMGISPDGTFWSQARSSTVGSTDTTSADAGGASNLWVRLVRSGDAVYGYQSVDGNAWTPVATNSVPMASEIYMGFGVASGSGDILSTCTFTNAIILP